MLLVGKAERGYFVEEYAKEKKLNFTCIPSKSSIHKQVNDILNVHCSTIVYDIEQYIDDPEDLAQEIQRIHTVNNTRVIILAPGYLADARIIQEIHSRGFNNFILSPVIAGMKDELEKSMNGYFDSNPPEQITAKAEENREMERQRSYTTIAVAGAMARIGTTTQAIQLCKYLMYRGHKVCYIEANASGYVEMIKNYDTEAKYDEVTERVSFQSLEMYNNMQRIHEYLKMDYEFYIYDFGSWTDKGFYSTSYLEKDIKIMVGGIKPNEIIQTTEVLRVAGRWDVSYIFSFVAQDKEKEILALMDDQAKHTYFAGYVPDMWHWNPVEYFSKICPCDDLSDNTKKVPKWSIFRKKRGI